MSSGPHFIAGFETDGQRVRREAPILRELHSLTNDGARKIIAAKGWRATIVKGNTPLRLIQYEESFEVQKGSVRAFCYFDEVAGRRAISGRTDKATAYTKAQAHLVGFNACRGRWRGD